MAKAKKILFIVQEMTPYVPDTQISKFGREVAESTQAKKREIRSFMPKWGIINERRNQLHEVIRLSGMNIIIDETDHPLIIKVASIQSAHMQVYFIDNDDYYSKRKMTLDDNGAEYSDNAERAVFYARGVLETVKKLKWTPDIIHCQGWISSIIPLYIKTAYAEEPSFRDCRVVYTPSDMPLEAPLPDNFPGVLQFRKATIEAMAGVPSSDKMQALNFLGIKYADGVNLMHPNTTYRNYAKKLEKLYLGAQKPENYGTAFPAFYDKVWSIGKEEEEEEEED
ncbi:MAG: glycogen/starch synthase [Bacteroidaceae bacterium]|nr:glycogen/starch synthase [Bacteroidaceae bacterium]